MDFGCGAGRSTRFIKLAAPLSRVIGFDRSLPMLVQARLSDPDGEYCEASGQYVLDSESFDVLVAANVLVEAPCHNDLAQVVREIARLTRVGGSVVIMATNEPAFRCSYTSFSYAHTGPIKDGTPVLCQVETSAGRVLIPDYVWTSDTITRLFEFSGCRAVNIERPPALENHPEKQETIPPPHSIFHFIKHHDPRLS